MTDSENALILAERLRGAIAAHNWTQQAVTASFGISSVSPLMENCEDLVFQADRALYRSKHAGRNCSSVYSNEDALADELPSRRAGDIRFKDAAA
jgi:diguanylate cyclase (GGDEF)-like protein